MRLLALSLTFKIVLQGERLIICLLIRGPTEKTNVCFRKTLFPYVTRENTTLTEYILITLISNNLTSEKIFFMGKI